MNGSGSIRQRANGRYQWVIAVGYDTNGKRVYRSGMADTYKDAVRDKKQAAAQATRQDGPVYRGTLGEFLAEFYDTYPWKSASYKGSCRSVMRQFKPIFYVPLHKLTRSTVKELYADWREEGNTFNTIERKHAFLRRALNVAVHEGKIEYSVVHKMILGKDEREEIVPLTDNQIKQLLADASTGPEWWNACVRLAYDSGMRRGELAGLRWSDVDFAKGDLHVRTNAVHDENYQIIIKGPKSKRGRRVIDLSAPVCAVLKAEYTRKATEALAKGSGAISDHYAFGGVKPRDPDALTRMFRAWRESHGYDDITFHTIRHTVASQMIANGETIQRAAQRLGDNPLTVQNTYLHWMPTGSRLGSEIMGAKALELGAK